MYNALIDAQTLNNHLFDPDWIIVDCRYDLMDKDAGYQSYLAGHIPGAGYAGLHNDLSSSQPVTDCGRHPVPSPEDLEDKLSAMGIDNRRQVVAYDLSGGVFAARLWWLLRYAGHDRAAVLDGGLDAWVQAGFELDVKQPQVVAGSFKARLDAGRLARLGEVENLARLVDSREPVRYRGDTEPMDRTGGHIPGAVNYYWKDNLDAQGRFLAPERLRRTFKDVYAGTAPEDVTFYCGSGVSACHNLLAAVHAGFPLPRLYAGSWSEWCSDPARPVAVGPEASTLSR